MASNNIEIVSDSAIPDKKELSKAEPLGLYPDFKSKEYGQDKELCTCCDCLLGALVALIIFYVVLGMFCLINDDQFKSIKNRSNYECGNLTSFMVSANDFNNLSSKVNDFETEIKLLNKYLTFELSTKSDLLQILQNVTFEYNAPKTEFDYQNLLRNECNETISQQLKQALDIQIEIYKKYYYIFIGCYVIAVLSLFKCFYRFNNVNFKLCTIGMFVYLLIILVFIFTSSAPNLWETGMLRSNPKYCRNENN